MSHYEVYLWTGDRKNFAEGSPLGSTAEFWRLRGEAIPATKDAVEKSLSFQGIAANDYIILDYAKYQEIFCMLQPEFNLLS
jgi:hypothetical protein